MPSYILLPKLLYVKSRLNDIQAQLPYADSSKCPHGKLLLEALCNFNSTTTYYCSFYSQTEVLKQHFLIMCNKRVAE